MTAVHYHSITSDMLVFLEADKAISIQNYDMVFETRFWQKWEHYVMLTQDTQILGIHLVTRGYNRTGL